MITAYDGKKYATFAQWKAAGYSVMKGQKSYMVTEDTFEPLFCETQVEKRGSGSRPDPVYTQEDWDLDHYDVMNLDEPH